MKLIELSKNGTVNKGKYFAMVDDDVFPIVNEYNWHYQNGYAYNKKMNIKLHQFIWNLKVGDIPEGLEIEHWDENGLNDQISNLRLATHSENICNITKYKNNKSGFKGISKAVCKKEKEDGSIYINEYWRAQIRKDKKTYTKLFPFTEQGLQQAVDWYKQKSLELHKEFSIYNRDE